MKTTFVRVKDKTTGHEFSINKDVADHDDTLTIIDKEAVDANGRPMAPKPHVELAKATPTDTNKSGGQSK